MYILSLLVSVLFSAIAVCEEFNSLKIIVCIVFFSALHHEQQCL